MRADFPNRSHSLAGRDHARWRSLIEGKTKARTQEDCEDPGATQPGLHAISSELSAQEIDSEDVAPLESEDDEPKLPEDDSSSEEEGANVTEARMEDTSIS